MRQLLKIKETKFSETISLPKDEENGGEVWKRKLSPGQAKRKQQHECATTKWTQRKASISLSPRLAPRPDHYSPLPLAARKWSPRRARPTRRSLPTQCRTAPAPHSPSRRRRPSSSPTARLRAGGGARAVAAST